MKLIMGSYTFGKGIKSWSIGNTQNITFIVTEDCNLRCKYCYITHKASNKRMNFEVAKKFIDYLFTDNVKKGDSVIIEFFGGEPLLEIDLIDKISDYFKLKSYEIGHDWSWKYRFNICTNGVNYGDEKVQKYFNKNRGKLSVAITLDGNKEKHDLQRVFPDGSGSYDIIIKNIPNWIMNYSASTKVTFASADLILLKDSIINLWNLGIYEVAANVVFENVWNEGDDKIFEDQLIQLADYVIDNKLYDKYVCTLFDEKIGYKYTDDEKKQTYCGAGKMLALGPNGIIYPCVRYKDYSLNNNPEWSFGNVDSGINMEKIRPFLLANMKLQSDSECLNCNIGTGCAYCQGFNYDDSKSSTNFHRAKYVCKMHKARVRANRYYFNRLSNELNIKKDITRESGNTLYFLMDSNFTSFCQSENLSRKREKMIEEILVHGLQYANTNFYHSMLVHSSETFDFEYRDEFNKYDISHIISIKFYEKAKQLHNVLWVFDKTSLEIRYDKIENCILNVYQKDIDNIIVYVNKIYKKVNRINLNIMNLNENFDFELYKNQLHMLKQMIIDYKTSTGVLLEMNVLTDLLFIDFHDNCGAGDNALTLGPDGNMYLCPAFYSDGIQNKIGSIISNNLDIKDEHLFKQSHHPLCTTCKSYQCINCIHLNKTATNEVNVSPSYQCKKAHLEQEVAYELRKELGFNDKYKKIQPPKYDDPIQGLINSSGFNTGVYKI